MKDLTLDVTALGELELSLSEFTETIKNLIITSIMIPKGQFFQNPEFGSRLHEIKKLTSDSLLLAKAYVEESLEWLIDTGKAASNAVEVTKIDMHRIKIAVDSIQADGLEITYETFFEVS